MKSFDVIKKQLVTKGKETDKELKSIDFKSEMNVDSKGDWCEIIKDIVAFANSGGGIIIFGVDDYGNKTSFEISKLLKYDPSKISDKISSYIDIDFTDFELVRFRRKDGDVVGLVIYPTFPPIIFSKAGNYAVENNKQKIAFQKGVLYMRKGTSSVPAKSNDLIKILEKEISNRRKQWLGNIRKVIDAPSDHEVHIVNKNMVVSLNEKGTPIKITKNHNAPEFRITNPDDLCPYNTTKTVKKINKLLDGRWKITNYDVLLVRYLFNICDDPEYYYHSNYGSSQYSEKFINWVLSEFEKDNSFFKNNRAKYHKIKYDKE